MSWHENLRRIAILFAVFSMASLACADGFESDQNELELSLRTNVLRGDSASANDVLGVGVIGRYYLDNGWFTGATLDTYEYDYESAARVAGIDQDPNESNIDALANSTVVSAFVGRLYGRDNKGFDWFWSAGVGIGFLDVDGFSGGADDGGTFALTYDAKTEIHLTSALGTSYHFTPTWSATFAARLEHHFKDVTATDSISGLTNTIDSQSPFGAYLSIDYRF